MSDWENPWTPEEMESMRKPRRTWQGLTIAQTDWVTRGAVDREQCPDCWRWHLDGRRNSREGHCWSCHLENLSPGHTSKAWASYTGQEEQPETQLTKGGFMRSSGGKGGFQKAGTR